MSLFINSLGDVAYNRNQIRSHGVHFSGSQTS